MDCFNESMNRDWSSYDYILDRIYQSAINPSEWTSVIETLKNTTKSIAAGFFVGTDKKTSESGSLNQLPWVTKTGHFKPARIVSDLPASPVRLDIPLRDSLHGFARSTHHSMGSNLVERHRAKALVQQMKSELRSV